jgi:UDP-glucuronate decarboxylase
MTSNGHKEMPSSMPKNKIYVNPPPDPQKKRILVTGGAGFIGSHLVDYLMLQGHEVIVADSFMCSAKTNVSQWLGHDNFELVRHDVVHPLYVEVDQIYHLACPASPVHYQSNAIKTLKTNVLGTLNVCGLAKRSKARVLISSTSEVYGDPDVHPQKETYFGNVNCIGPRSCYDEGKRAAEALVMDYHRQHNVDIRIARIFNTYGPRLQFHDGRVVSNFIVQALRKEPLTLYGDGSQTRSFCFVTDLVEGLVRLMNGDELGPINLGNPGEYSMAELATEVQAAVGSTVPIEYRELPQDDPRQRKPDISKAKQYLNNWQPTVHLKEGLKHTCEDFKIRADRNPGQLFCLHQKGALKVDSAEPAAKRVKTA